MCLILSNLHEVSVIFWDEFLSNDRILMEAVLEEFKTRWEEPRYYIFVCAGDFAQVCIYPRILIVLFTFLLIFLSVRFFFSLHSIT